MPSVIIPAHNEAAVISDTLRALSDGTGSDEGDGALEVIVVCNGCTDNTADVARSFAGVLVLEAPEPGKAAALNLGDREATSWPRVYLDADVKLSAAGIAGLCRALDRPEPHAASPSLEMDVNSSSWIVRQYFRIWSELPVIRTGLVGRGAYALNKAGHERLGLFPALTADDLYVHRLFPADQRTVLSDIRSVVRAPHTTKALVLRKVRSYSGIAEMSSVIASSDESSSDWIGVVRAQPRLIPAVPAYVFVSLLAKIRSYQKRRRGDTTMWERDETSRQ